jgi:hypothetical protein
MSGALAVYLPQALLLGWLLHQLSGRRPAWLLGLLLAAVPLAGLPLAGHLRGLFGDPSATTVQLLLLVLFSRSPTSLASGWRAPLLVGLGGLAFYALALGGAPLLGIEDPYRLGYQPKLLVAALSVPALYLWWREQPLWLSLFTVDLLVFAADWHSSPNFWDLLIDPPLVVACLVLAWRNRPRRARQDEA